MGQSKRLYEEAQQHWELSEGINAVIDDLDGAALGVAKQIADKGLTSLSEKQTFVFEKYIQPRLQQECSRCGCDVPYSELYTHQESSMCGYCDHMTAKAANE